MQTRLTRAEVPVAETWNLDDLFASDSAWESALSAVAADLPRVEQYKGRFADGPGVLLACLNEHEALSERFNRVATYASLRGSEDGSSPNNQAKLGRTAALTARVEATLSFIRSEILLLPEGTLERYLAAEPGLVPFQQFLTDLLEARTHMLAPQAEAVLAGLGEVTNAPYMIYERAKSSDMAFDSITTANGRELAMSFSLYEDLYVGSPDADLRRKANASFIKGLNAYKNTLAATFATEVKKNVVLAKERGYASATHMLLQPQKVTTEMYGNLLDVIQTELAPHMRRYARLRKRVLGLDRVLHCDLKAPLDPGYNPPTTYAEASELIIDALAVLGPEYGKIIRSALKERWVDLADNIGKSTGAFCSTPYGVHPYILITWTDSMRSAFVLAHELGHAGHFGLASKYQRFVNMEPSMYFIEAPSTSNELLLGQHILSRSTDARMRRWVIMQFLGTYHHNFITHLLEGELQRRIYALAEAGEPITETVLSQNKGDILQQFWGDTVEIDAGARLTWMRQPHYYMGLYPYTYSAGLTAGTAVAQAIREEGQSAVGRWLEALKAGGTLRPLELMRLAGVDMSKPDPIRKAVAYVGSLVDELERSFE